MRAGFEKKITGRNDVIVRDQKVLIFVRNNKRGAVAGVTFIKVGA